MQIKASEYGYPYLVAILGAGFSSALSKDAPPNSFEPDKPSIPYPCGSQLLCWPYVEWGNYYGKWNLPEFPKLWYKDDANPLVQVLRTAFCSEFLDDKGFIRRDTGEPVNYELVYSHLQASTLNPTNTVEEKTLIAGAIRLLNAYLKYSLNVFVYNKEFVAERASQFLSLLPRNSALFTTNIDNAMEIAWMHSVGSKAAKPLTDFNQSLHFVTNRVLNGRLELGRIHSNCDYFHLHGCIQWATCSNEKCHLRHHPEILANNRLASGPCDRCGAERVPEILAPTAMKDYAMKPLYTRQLVHLRECLEYAQVLLVVGYSFGQHDGAINQVVFRSLERRDQPLQRIVVVDPCHRRVSDLFRQFTWPEELRGMTSLADLLPEHLALG